MVKKYMYMQNKNIANKNKINYNIYILIIKKYNIKNN